MRGFLWVPARMALNLSGCKNVAMSPDSSTADSEQIDGQSIYDRIRSEKPPLTEFTISSAGKEPTLDEARADLAAAVGALADTIFSKTYGPLVGTVTKTSVETVLKNAETTAHRAKGDAKLVIEELAARIFHEKKK